MSKGIAFSDRQVEQLTELLNHQRESILVDANELVDQKVTALTQQFSEILDQRFIEERAVTRAIIQAEVATLNDRLERIEDRLKQFFETEDEDVRALSRRLTRVKAQVTALERSIAKLQLVD